MKSSKQIRQCDLAHSAFTLVELPAVSRRERSAFTLVELLVVIGIIAVLIGILLPALSKAREQSKTVQCLSNLRQLGTAFQMYLSEQKRMVPACIYLDSAPAGFQNRETWATFLVNARYLRGVPTVPLANPNAPQIKPTAGPVASGAFYCPNGSLDFTTDTGAPASNTDARGSFALRVMSQSTFIWLDNWYGINAATQETAPPNADPANYNAGAFELPAAADRIRVDPTNSYITGYAKKALPSKKSSEIVLLYDGLWMNASIGASGGAWRINARHNKQKMTNLLFCDGHADSYLRSVLPPPISANGPADMTIATLSKPPYNVVKWRTDQ